MTEDLKDQVEHEIYLDDRSPANRAVGPTAPVSAAPEPAGPPPVATVENVPGLEAAIAEPAAAPKEAAEQSGAAAPAAGPPGTT